MASQTKNSAQPPGSGREGAGLWWLLLSVPLLLIVVVLVPGLGTYREGLLQEWLGTHVLDTDDFVTFAGAVTRWGGAMLGLACVIGLLVWWGLLRGWRARLRDLSADRVMNYRGYVFRYFWVAVIAAIVVGAGIGFLSAELRPMPIVSWIYLLCFCGLAAALQYYFAVLGIPATRRLLRGRS